MNAEYRCDQWPQQAFKGTKQNKQLNTKIRKTEGGGEEECEAGLCVDITEDGVGHCLIPTGQK